MFGFSAAGEVLGNIFGTRKAVDNLLDKDKGLLVRAGGFFNDLHYSDAEKAKDDSAQREWAIRQLEALAPFKIVQRILAFAATALWLLVGVNVLVGMWVEAIYPTIYQQVDGVNVLVTEGLHVVQPLLQFAFSDYVFWPVTLAYGLYFSGGVVDSMRRKPRNE